MGRAATDSRARVLAAAGLLFLSIFVLRVLYDAPGAGITFLYVIPIVLVAVEFGRRAGMAAGTVGWLLFAVWDQASGTDLPALGYINRALIMVGVGIFTGIMAERLRATAAEAEIAARHFALARDMLASSDESGHFVRINGRWSDVLGWTEEELMSRPFIDFVHPEDRERTRERAPQLMRGEATANFVNRYATKDGGWRYIEWASMGDPEAGLLHAAARDVTDARVAEEARREAEQRFRRAFEDSAVGMAVVGVEGDEKNCIIEANEALARILGRTPEELEGRPTLADFAHPDDLPTVAEGLTKLYEGQTSLFRCELRLVNADGRPVWVDLTTSIVRGDDGRPRYRLSQAVDIDERKRSAEQLRFLADHDPLSGVFNRRRFEQELEREVGHAATRGGRGAVLLFDIDRFKAINDTLGHAAGDAVISRIGEVLRDRLRTTDVISRLGGDEFAVLLRRVSPEEAWEVASSLRGLLNEGLPVLDGLGQITVSLGVAAFGGDRGTHDPDALLSEADRAMYEAKRSGGNTVGV